MKQIAFIFIFFGFFGILIGSNIYIPQRFAWYYDIERAGILYFISVAITIFMIGGLIAFSNSLTKSGSMVYSTAAVTLGVMLYLLLAVLITDILRFFTDFQPLTYGLIVVFLAFFVSLYGIWNSTNLKISQIEIPIPGLKEEIKAIQKIVDQTNGYDPDVVFLTGDLFDGRINLKEENLRPLKQIEVPVFFVEGNHDLYTGVRTIKSMLRNIGINVLENEVFQWNGLQIVGLNHMAADGNTASMHASKDGPTIRNVLSNLPIEEKQPSILLHHSPDGIEYASKSGIDLYLSGHTHAGQLFPINYISEWVFPYNRGLHSYNGTKIFVSEGAGTFGPPMRIATKSEITVVKLYPN